MRINKLIEELQKIEAQYCDVDMFAYKDEFVNELSYEDYTGLIKMHLTVRDVIFIKDKSL